MTAETLSQEDQIELALEKESRTLQRQQLLKQLWKLRQRHENDKAPARQARRATIRKRVSLSA